MAELFQKLFVRFELLGENLIAMCKVKLNNKEASESSNAKIHSRMTKFKSSQKDHDLGQKERTRETT